VYIDQTFGLQLEAKGVKNTLEVIKYLTDCNSVGRAVCERAEELNVYAVVLASHNKGAIQEFFLGSVSKYCTHHCTHPVVILH